MHPGAAVSDDNAAVRAPVRTVATTAYHPVGTLRIGEGDAPVTPRLRYRNFGRLWPTHR